MFGRKSKNVIECENSIYTNYEDDGFGKEEYNFLVDFAKKADIDLLEVYNSVNPQNFPLTWKDFRLDLPKETADGLLLGIRAEMANVTNVLTDFMTSFQIKQYGPKKLTRAQVSAVLKNTEILFCSEINEVTAAFIEIGSNFTGVDDDIAGSEKQKLSDIFSYEYFGVLCDSLIGKGGIEVI